MVVGTLVRWYVGTLVSGYVGMATSTTAPASCYLGRRRWTRCRSCSTGCREMAPLPLRDGELPLESVVAQSSDCAVTAELRHDPCLLGPRGPAALRRPRDPHLSLARTCLQTDGRRSTHTGSLFLCAACSASNITSTHVLFGKLAESVNNARYYARPRRSFSFTV